MAKCHVTKCPVTKYTVTESPVLQNASIFVNNRITKMSPNCLVDLLNNKMSLDQVSYIANSHFAKCCRSRKKENEKSKKKFLLKKFLPKYWSEKMKTRRSLFVIF